MDTMNSKKNGGNQISMTSQRKAPEPKATPSQISKLFADREISALNMDHDDFTKTIHQARAVATLLSEPEDLDVVTPATFSNAFWVIFDKLDELEQALICPQRETAITQ